MLLFKAFKQCSFTAAPKYVAPLLTSTPTGNQLKQQLQSQLYIVLQRFLVNSSEKEIIMN